MPNEQLWQFGNRLWRELRARSRVAVLRLGRRRGRGRQKLPIAPKAAFGNYINRGQRVAVLTHAVSSELPAIADAVPRDSLGDRRVRPLAEPATGEADANARMPEEIEARK